MNSMEEISVILPVYNGEATLDLAVCSVLDQRDADLRLYICDDASTDATWKLIQAWGERDRRVVCLRNERNLGAGGSRNRCLTAAKGKYIALMDGDDWSHPERLRIQRETLEERTDLAFVGTRGRFFHRQPGDAEEEYWFVRAPRTEDFLMTLPYVHASLLFRRSAIETVKGYDTGSRSMRSEDYDLLMRLYAAGHRGENLDKALYFIRMDEETFRRRKYRYRLQECRVKWRGFSQMGLMPRGIPYALKPLAVGLIPRRALEQLKKGYYQDK